MHFLVVFCGPASDSSLRIAPSFHEMKFWLLFKQLHYIKIVYACAAVICGIMYVSYVCSCNECV